MSNYVEILSGVACKVLETSAFAFADECTPAQAEVGATDGLVSTISFRGQVEGQLTILAPHELCSTLAANILSLEPEDVEPSHAADTLNEMANVICGHWITSVCGHEPVVQLNVPKASTWQAAMWEKHRASSTSACLLVEDLPLVLDLSLTPSA